VAKEEGEGRRWCHRGGELGNLAELVGMEVIAGACRRGGEARRRDLAELVAVVVEGRWEISQSLFDFFIATGLTVYVASSATTNLIEFCFLTVME